MSSSNELPDRAPMETFAGIAMPGSYIVPHFDPQGKKVEKGEIYGHPSHVKKVINAIAAHAERTGGKVAPPAPPAEPPKKAKVKKVKAGAPQHPPKIEPIVPDGLEEVLLPKSTPKTAEEEYDHVIDVVFSTDFGKITLTAMAALDTESAVGLVFRNEKELRFVPKTGTYLDVKIGSTEMKVYFPGIVLTWTDHVKKIMLLIKADNDKGES